MKELSKLEKIFSITNNPGHKIIRFLGVPITIDSRKIFNTKYGLLPIDNNKIVFCNFKGGGFGCNSKYIAEKIIEKHLPYKLVWLVNKCSNYINTDNMPDCIKIVDFKSPKALYELATAKIWIDNHSQLFLNYSNVKAYELSDLDDVYRVNEIRGSEEVSRLFGYKNFLYHKNRSLSEVRHQK